MTTERERQTATKLWQGWGALWSGNLALADELIADGFVLHTTGNSPGSPTEIGDARSFARWVAAIQDRYRALSYTTELGPLVDGEFLVGHWRVVGILKSEQRIERVGTDIFRVHEDRLAECWTVHDDVRG
jgi:hypothetical protein